MLLTKHLAIEVPVICGAMLPCSNPELVAAASEAGAIGIVQPISLTYVHGYDFLEGLKYIRTLTQKPIGLNLLIEGSSKVYLERNKKWLDTALEQGVKFFISALGNPKWVVDRLRGTGSILYHDVTERKWAEKALEAGVNGLICVNNRAGGHAGNLSPQQLVEDLKSLNVPLICAGGIGEAQQFKEALAMGYSGVQMGTRFIASQECSAHEDYKQAILKAHEKDIVLTPRITGVPVSIIRTPYVEKMGIEANPLEQKLMTHPRTKHLVRMLYSLKSVWQLKRSNKRGSKYKDFFQAGKSVDRIHTVKAVSQIVEEFKAVQM